MSERDVLHKISEAMGHLGDAQATLRLSGYGRSPKEIYQLQKSTAIAISAALSKLSEALKALYNIDEERNY